MDELHYTKRRYTRVMQDGQTVELYPILHGWRVSVVEVPDMFYSDTY